MKRAIFLAGLLFSSPGYAFELQSLAVDKNLRAGTLYAATFTYTGNAKITRACFFWSLEGPYCFKPSKHSHEQKTITTKLRTNNPQRYKLKGYVEYLSGAQVKNSNSVTIDINVVTAAAPKDGDTDLIRLCSRKKPQIKVASNAPKGAEGFSGVFKGRWGGLLLHTLVVHTITKKGTAKGYYAWGRYPKWDIKRAGCQQFTGKIVDNKLKLKLNNARVSYGVTGDGVLVGAFKRGKSTTIGKFKRQ